MTTDPVDVKTANKERRELWMKYLKGILLGKIAVNSDSALFDLHLYRQDKLEYLYCFALIFEKKGDYENNIISGFFSPESEIVLFYAEKDCVEGNNNASMNSDIPALEVTSDDYPIVECIALNLSTLDQEEYDVAMQNYRDIASVLNSK